jgi:hypothetical protein
MKISTRSSLALAAALFASLAVHAQEQPREQPNFQIEILTPRDGGPGLTLTNRSAKTLTACTIEFSVSFENGSPMRSEWDAPFLGVAPLKTGDSLSMPLPHEVGHPYPDKVVVIAGIWEDGETFGNADWVRVLLENRGLQRLRFNQATTLLQQGLDKDWTYDQFLDALKGMPDSGDQFGIRLNLETNPQLRNKPQQLTQVVHRLLDGLNRKYGAIQQAKPLPANPHADMDGLRILLHALGARFGVDEGLENGQDVAAVIDHTGEDVAQRGIVLGFAMPFQQHCGRHFDIPAQLFGGMTS